LGFDRNVDVEVVGDMVLQKVSVMYELVFVKANYLNPEIRFTTRCLAMMVKCSRAEKMIVGVVVENTGNSSFERKHNERDLTGQVYEHAYSSPRVLQRTLYSTEPPLNVICLFFLGGRSL
jgi:hypothetical protein